MARGFRLGVTGRRAVPREERARVAREIAVLLADVEAAIARQGTGDLAPRLLTSLAEGADRIAARGALARGWRVDAVLPFAPEEYARDFEASTGSEGEFSRLLSELEAGGGSWLALDGRRDGTARAYARAGEVVAGRSDLLLAVLDEAPSQGPGGTRDTALHALARGVPVWWIHTFGRPPVLAEDVAALDHRVALERGDNAARLAARLRGLVSGLA